MVSLANRALRPETGIGLLVAVALAVLVAVALARLSGYQPPAPELAAVVESRDLVFRDLGGGSVRVVDADTGAEVIHFGAAEENFIRGVLRSFARERRARGIGSAAPFRLTRHEDGRLAFQDLSTGRRVDLQAFGPTNFGAFARLLDDAAGGAPAGGP